MPMLQLHVAASCPLKEQATKKKGWIGKVKFFLMMRGSSKILKCWYRKMLCLKKFVWARQERQGERILTAIGTLAIQKYRLEPTVVMQRK